MCDDEAPRDLIVRSPFGQVVPSSTIGKPPLEPPPPPADEPICASTSGWRKAAQIGLALLGAITAVGTGSPALAAAPPQTTLAATVTPAPANGVQMLKAAASPASASTPSGSAATGASQQPVASEPLDLVLPATGFSNRYAINAEIEQAATRTKVPVEILKAVAWQETGWKHTVHGAVVKNINRDKSGQAVSADWGIAQINDRAHPKAFPRAKADARFNLEYAGRLLRSLYNQVGDWNKAVERYNGINAAYPRAISHHVAVRPWSAGVLKDELDVARATRATVERQQVAAQKLAAEKDRAVAAAQQQLDRLGGGIAPESLPSAARQNLQKASATLQRCQNDAARVHERLGNVTAKLTLLDAELPSLQRRLDAETARLTEVYNKEEAARAAVARNAADAAKARRAVAAHRP